MDVNDLRSLVTVVSLACFVGICVWTWSRRHQRHFDEAARIPLMNDVSLSNGDRHE